MNVINSTINSQSGGYISKVIFNNGQSVKINNNDIVIFAGPNNAGKSQSLKDIYELCESKKPTIVVEDVGIVKYSQDISKVLNAISVTNDYGDYVNYSGLDTILSHMIYQIIKMINIMVVQEHYLWLI